MKTPASKSFLDEVGRAVHYLNTIVVGLAGVETGECEKPVSLDISWNPSDLRSSSRSARSYLLKSTIVFIATQISAYVSELLRSPDCNQLPLLNEHDMAERFRQVTKELGVSEVDLTIGPLLIIHWRNRIIHPKSNARLRKKEKREFQEASTILERKYKNLDPGVTLKNFETNTPSLKDVSSLIAMSINWAKAAEAQLEEPRSHKELMAWIEAVGLSNEFARAKRVSANAAKPTSSMANFFVTYFPGLKRAYEEFSEVDG